jgi:hypothetical protein
MPSRREFIKKAAYAAPMILTLDVALAEASTGSGSTAGTAGTTTTTTRVAKRSLRRTMQNGRYWFWDWVN